MGNWENVKLISRGKVRDVYENGNHDRVLLVASDRVSAFDNVLGGVMIRGKGRMLTRISKYWFEKTKSMVPNAYSAAKYDFSSDYRYEEKVAVDDKATTEMVKLNMLPIEAIVRGYITGSMWAKYAEGEREFCGIRLRDGYKEHDMLDDETGAIAPIFTPTTKVPKGEKDQNLTYDEMVKHLEKNGVQAAMDRAELVREYSMRLYRYACNKLLEKDIILADTKFEFGINPETGQLMLGDELLTPDSSRFWSYKDYEAGRIRSLDKQTIRDFVKAHPSEEIPLEVLERATADYERITNIITTDRKL